jgi:DNA processing protein
MSDSSSQSSASRLTEQQLVDWLRLIRSENVGPRTFRAPINRFGGAPEALDALPDVAARSAQGRAIRIADRNEILREIECSRAVGVRFVAMSDPDYPPLLRELICRCLALRPLGSTNSYAPGERRARTAA